MQTGKIRWFSYSKGCGFIIPDDGGGDVFAHFSAFADAALQSLRQNDRVRYRVSAGPRGRVASQIRRLECHLGEAAC
jgi:CspA family cold shock protein